MRKKVTAGFITLAIGVILTGFSYGKRALSADTITEASMQTISISLFIGIALIILSAILFIRASDSKG
jgi:hypothetical protein